MRKETGFVIPLLALGLAIVFVARATMHATAPEPDELGGSQTVPLVLSPFDGKGL
jgi:hypothetical protein